MITEEFDKQMMDIKQIIKQIIMEVPKEGAIETLIPTLQEVVVKVLAEKEIPITPGIVFKITALCISLYLRMDITNGLKDYIKNNEDTKATQEFKRHISVFEESGELLLEHVVARICNLIEKNSTKEETNNE